MKRMNSLKLQMLCLILVAHSGYNAASADSIQFAVDASLGEQELEVVESVVRTITQAADNSNSIGILVYDSVFQRSTPIAIANDAQKTSVLDTLAQLSQSDISNLAVAIEKGNSELEAEGGYLLVFGQSDIRVTDPEKLSTYTNWLELVLMPDSEKMGVDIVLVSPAAVDPSVSFQTSVSAFFDLTDRTSVIEGLSTVLPESLVARLGDPEIPATLPEPVVSVENGLVDIDITEQQGISDAVTESESVAVTADAGVTGANRLSTTQMMMIGLSAALLLASIAIGFLVFKLSRKSETRNARQNAPAARRAKSEPSNPQPNSSDNGQPTVAKQVRRHTEIDNQMDKALSDPDATIKNTPAQARDLASTVQRAQPANVRPIKTRPAETADDLEEIRALTKQREKSLI